MKFTALIGILLTMFLVAGCSMGPTNAEVEAAYRESLQRNDVMGLVAGTVQIDKFQVDKTEKRENGVYVATVTVVSSAHVGPLSVGGAKQTTLRLKKVGDAWVVLQ
uniref:Lipoprotein n=1 Tax=Desulfovibrio sp. U5L TaxID=596152 RepID=I2Q796_9BACT